MKLIILPWQTKGNALNCMVKTINYKMKVIHCKMKTLLHTQSEYNVLKYKVNEATLLPLLLKTKITATKALDGKKYFFYSRTK